LIYNLCLTINRHIDNKNIFLGSKKNVEFTEVENLAKKMEISFREKKNYFDFLRKNSSQINKTFSKIETHFSFLVKELYEIDHLVIKQLSLRTKNKNFSLFRKDIRESYNEIKDVISDTHLDRVDSLISSFRSDSLAALEVILECWNHGKKDLNMPSCIKKNKKLFDFMTDFCEVFGVSENFEETYNNFYILSYKKIV